ncbi:MAG: hypothetical protein ABT940_02775 [Alphaproteobacteria bacterium]
MVVLFVLGALLFNPPLLFAYSRDGLLFGVPSLYAMLFLGWLLLIVLLASTIEGARPMPQGSGGGGMDGVPEPKAAFSSEPVFGPEEPSEPSRSRSADPV